MIVPLVLMGGILFVFRFVRQKEEPQQRSNLNSPEWGEDTSFLFGRYPLLSYKFP